MKREWAREKREQGESGDNATSQYRPACMSHQLPLTEQYAQITSSICSLLAVITATASSSMPHLLFLPSRLNRQLWIDRIRRCM